MEINVAVSKINQYATSVSGDTLEVVERPNGGLSVVMADGQTHGRGAKIVSNMVVRKVISLLAEGVRDGAAARAASDYLYTERDGKVSACLNILSIDLVTKTIVITCNNPVPLFIANKGSLSYLKNNSSRIGTARNVRPSITEIPLELGLTIVMFTDGVELAGDRCGTPIDIQTHLESFLEDEDPTANSIANSLLTHAIQLDEGRPADDMSVVVLRVGSGEDDQIRRMSVRLPLVI
jgi:serine phosphatase RsbU (regulator of sigma subunit)